MDTAILNVAIVFLLEEIDNLPGRLLFSLLEWQRHSSMSVKEMVTELRRGETKPKTTRKEVLAALGALLAARLVQESDDSMVGHTRYEPTDIAVPAHVFVENSFDEDLMSPDFFTAEDSLDDESTGPDTESGEDTE